MLHPFLLLPILALTQPPTAEALAAEEEEVMQAIAEADPGQLAAMEALSGINPQVLEGLESISEAELDALMKKAALGAQLDPQERELVEANVAVSVAGFDATLNYQQGEILLGEGLATLQLDERFRFIGPSDAKRVLTQAWGNPAGPECLGMLVPAEVSVVHPFEGWGIRINFTADGYVREEGFDELDPDAAIETLREQIAEANKDRLSAGASAMQVVGWAQAPAYDPKQHSMSWAVEYADTSSDAPHSLNYASRILGRRGVLEFSAISSMKQRDTIVHAMQQLPKLSQFASGESYGEFSEGDPVAPYTVADLLAGGASKVDGWSGLRRFAPIGLVVLIALALRMRRRRED